MSFLISIIIIVTVLSLSARLSKRYKSHRYFISIPYIASVILALISYLLLSQFSFSFLFHPFSERLFVTIFLFSIGYQISITYRLLHWKRLFLLLGICAILLLALTGVATFLEDRYLRLLIGPTMLGFNEELVLRYVSTDLQPIIFYWGSIQLLIIFFLTPLFLNIAQKYYPSFSKINKSKDFIEHEEFSIVISPKVLWVIALGIAIVYMKIEWIPSNIPFLFDFVIAMVVGFLYGLWSKRVKGKDQAIKNAHAYNQLGTVGLYGFIVAIVHQASYVDLSNISFLYLSILIMKTIFVFVLTFFLVFWLFRRLSFADSLVAIVAGWTFILNAPVVCMHGMRTVVNKYGPSPGVLLIVPPVILWLVNYLQMLLHHLIP